MSDAPDELAVGRYVDGELRAADREAFEARVRVDGDLQRSVAELRGLRRWFAPERRADVPSPGTGFRDRVRSALAVAQTGGAAAALDEVIEVWARRLMVAAALILGLGLLMYSGLLRSADSGRLVASPDEIRREIEKLDAAIRRENMPRRSEAEPR